jgi:hypothetical protein
MTLPLFANRYDSSFILHCGAARISRFKPMLNIALAADPIFPGYLVPTRIIATFSMDIKLM